MMPNKYLALHNAKQEEGRNKGNKGREDDFTTGFL